MRLARSFLRSSTMRSLLVRSVSWALREFGSANLREDLLRLVGHDAKVIFDVGANVGQSAEWFSMAFPSAVIFSFEPSPFEYARLSTRKLARVRSFNVAIGATDTTAMFRLNTDGGTSSFLEPNVVGRALLGGRLDEVGKIEVQMRSLDTFAAERALHAVDLLKVDAQGFEFEILRGARQLLSSVRVIQIECNFIPQYTHSSTFSDIDLFLRGFGFYLYNIYDLYRDARSGQLVFGDGVFLNAQAFRKHPGLHQAP